MHCSLLSKSDCSKDGPTIETTDLQIKETHSGLLNCNVSSNPVSVITWRHESRAVDITEELVKGEALYRSILLL